MTTQNTRWQGLTSQQKKQAAKAFSVQQQMAALDDAAAKSGGKAVSFQEYYRYFHGQGAMTPAMKMALRTNDKLRADVDHLVQQSSYQFPLVAAASTGDLAERSGEGYAIKWTTSKATGDVYVLVEAIDSAHKARTALVTRNGEGDYERYALPDMTHGSAQLVVKADSSLVKDLKDVNVEVFLQ